MSNGVNSEQGHSGGSAVKTATGDDNFEQGHRPAMETGGEGPVTKGCLSLVGVVNAYPTVTFLIGEFHNE